MITNANPAVVLPGIQNVMTAELYGLSTDTKPTLEIPNGSVFIEIDTGNVFFFNGSTNVWVSINSSEV